MGAPSAKEYPRFPSTIILLGISEGLKLLGAVPSLSPCWTDPAEHDTHVCLVAPNAAPLLSLSFIFPEEQSMNVILQGTLCKPGYLLWDSCLDCKY